MAIVFVAIDLAKMAPASGASGQGTEHRPNNTLRAGSTTRLDPKPSVAGYALRSGS